MANSNFVVQNGLTVGGLTIFAGNSDITTSGNISVTGGGSFGGLSSNQIYQGANSNVNVSAATITVGISGSGNVATFSSTGVTIAGTLNAGTLNAATIGNASAVLYGTLNSSSASQPNITTLAGVTSIGASGSTTLTGTLQTASQPNITTLAGLTGFGTAGVTTTAAGNFTITGCLTVNGTTTTINNTIQETTEYVSTIDATTVRATTLGNTGATLTGTLSTASQPNITTLAGVTSIGASGSTTLTGTLQTAAQTNITSVGTLTGLTVSGAIVPNGNLTVNLGSTTAWWNNIYGTAIHSLYADLAENYQGDKAYAPGTVVMFGGSSEVTVADADTTAVAGVVSTNPAHLMNGGLTGANVVPVAFTGRVPCQIIGPVKKGDLMVSAGFGYAKASANPSVGQVIGKALQEVTFAGKAVIEVVVGRF